MTIKKIIESNRNEIAFIVGNGINRYPNNPKAISWESLLLTLWEKFADNPNSILPKGVSLTEFYDLLDINNIDGISTNYLIQKEAGKILEAWSDATHHRKFVEKAKSINAPVLTTNFDLILPKTLELQQLECDTKKFTDFYPWSTYYSDNHLNYPTDGFGIWYINGLITYHRSIRLGLSHYMGSVQKARSFLHRGDDSRLFSGKDIHNWKGCKTWLHIIFNMPLYIFGLALEENEVFLRWLLIERARYFRKFPERRKDGWYITKKPYIQDEKYLGKKYFLENVGFNFMEVENYEDMYESPWHLY